MKKIYTLVSFLAIAVVYSQDIHFSQFNSTPLLVNPANTAADNDFRAIANYKDQWRSVTTPYKTFLVSAESKVRLKHWKPKEKSTLVEKIKSNLGAGLCVYRDAAGDAQMSLTTALFSLASQLTLSEKNGLSLGLQGGFSQRSLNTANLKWDSQYNGVAYDPSLSSGEGTYQSFTYGDFSAGLAWKYGAGEKYIAANDEVKANLGVAVYHINAPKLKYSNAFAERQERKYVVNGGLFKGIANTNLSIIPSFFYAQQGKLQETMLATMFKYQLTPSSIYTGYTGATNVGLGIQYRVGDAIIPTILIEKGKYHIGFSYDINLSNLSKTTYGRGGFEICLKFVTPNPYLYQVRP